MADRAVIPGVIGELLLMLIVATLAVTLVGALLSLFDGLSEIERRIVDLETNGGVNGK